MRRLLWMAWPMLGMLDKHGRWLKVDKMNLTFYQGIITTGGVRILSLHVQQGLVNAGSQGSLWMSKWEMGVWLLARNNACLRMWYLSYHNAICLMSRMLKIGSTPRERGFRCEARGLQFPQITGVLWWELGANYKLMWAWAFSVLFFVLVATPRTVSGTLRHKVNTESWRGGHNILLGWVILSTWDSQWENLLFSRPWLVMGERNSNCKLEFLAHWFRDHWFSKSGVQAPRWIRSWYWPSAASVSSKIS